jgi:molybdopterin/thiamine biosynthesis adenylyltransferase
MQSQSPKRANQTHERFKDADFYNPDLSVIVLGAGGIGSHLTYALCRQGYEIFIYDDDRVEIHNIGSQLYNVNHIGKNKAEIAVNYCKEFGNATAYPMGRFEADSPIDNIVFSCFDNMKYRKIAFDKWLEHQLSKDAAYKAKHPKEVNAFIDMRMDAESWQVYLVNNKKDAEEYVKTLFEDSEVPDAPCSYKATCHTGVGVASYAAGLFLNLVANKKMGIDLRQTYFKTFYDASLLRFEQHV